MCYQLMLRSGLVLERQTYPERNRIDSLSNGFDKNQTELGHRCFFKVMSLVNRTLTRT